MSPITTDLRRTADAEKQQSPDDRDLSVLWEAWEEHYEPMRRRLAWRAGRPVSDHEVHDAVTDALLRLHRALTDGAIVGDASGWLATVAWREFLRRNRREKGRAQFEKTAFARTERIASNPGPEDVALERAGQRGASSVGEITGRVFALIVMARYADERAVADSSSAGYELREPTDRPWDDALVDLIDEICAARLPTHLTERAIRERRDAREFELQEAKERAAARVRLDGIDERLEDLTDDERAAALRDAEIAYGPYGEGVWHLRQKIAAIRNRAQQHTTTGATDDPVSDDDPAVPATTDDTPPHTDDADAAPGEQTAA